MKLSHLKTFDLIYVATPFTLYEAGLEAAFIDASKLMGKLLAAGVTNALSPIVEAYPISLHGELDPLALSIWKPFCAARMGRSDAMIVGMLPGWSLSSGVNHEIQVMAGKPIYLMNPADLSFSPWSASQ
jgi:hypothetical protein